MPKLLLFVPCLKAVGGDDGLLTIVSLLEYIALSVPEDTVLEPLTATNLQWQLVCVWHRERSDEGRQFEIKVEIALPNGTVVPLFQNDLQLTGRTTKVRIDGGNAFPIGLEGDHILKVAIREVPSGDWAPAGEYPVNVNHSGTPTP